MNAFDLLEPAEKRGFGLLVLLALLTGALLASGVALLGQGVVDTRADAAGFGVLAVFLVVVAKILIFGQILERKASTLVSGLVARLRGRIAGRVSRLGLREFEILERDRVRTAMTTTLDGLAASATSLTAVLGLVGAAAFVLAYAFWLSLHLFWLMAGASLLALVVLIFAGLRQQDAEAAARQAQSARDRALGELIGGVRELKLDRERRAAIVAAHLTPALATVGRERRRGARWGAMNRQIADALPLALAGVAVLAYPLVAADGGTVGLEAGLVALVLPVVHTLELPRALRAWTALETLRTLDRDLGDSARVEGVQGDGAQMDGAQMDGAAPGPPPRLGCRITFDAVSFRYIDARGRPGFAMGPLSFDLAPGGLHILAGANGSGRSTLLKLAMGLYRPTAGRILVDGEQADEAARRHLSAAVFADDHAFDRFYGLGPVEGAGVESLLRTLGLPAGVRDRHGRIAVSGLAAPQRRRLALAAALVEDKPVYLFDETAAGQDEAFRDRFYHEILPGLQRRGKTVIVATQDERYFDLADHLLLLEKGWLADEWEATAGPR